MNPAVFSDPQVVVQLVPPRGRGRPTLYSLELVEEFCDLIVDGLTIAEAAQRPGMPSRRTIKYWLKKYPEFRREFEESVQFRNQCWMDDCVYKADHAAPGTNVALLRTQLDMRWKQLSGARLKAVTAPGEHKPIGDGEAMVHDHPLHGQLYEWELEYCGFRRSRPCIPM
jgi:hypothetical protein